MEANEAKTPRDALLALRERFQGQNVTVGYTPHQGQRERERKVRKMRRIKRDEDI